MLIFFKSQIGAGSDSSNSHSAAIDTNGRIYLFGATILCGHGEMNLDSTEAGTTNARSRFTMYPREVHLPEVRADNAFKNITI